MLCNKIKQWTADILIPHSKGNHSSFLTPTVVNGRRPFRPKFALKVPHNSTIGDLGPKASALLALRVIWHCGEGVTIISIIIIIAYSHQSSAYKINTLVNFRRRQKKNIWKQRHCLRSYLRRLSATSLACQKYQLVPNKVTKQGNNVCRYRVAVEKKKSARFVGGMIMDDAQHGGDNRLRTVPGRQAACWCFDVFPIEEGPPRGGTIAGSRSRH